MMNSFKDCGKVPETDTFKIEILVSYAILMLLTAGVPIWYTLLATHFQLQTVDQDTRYYGGGDLKLDSDSISDPGFKYNIYR